jgi:DNA-directed RNA polymerase III subunit RPC3
MVHHFYNFISRSRHVVASSVYAQVLYKLVTQSYLKPSTILSHISPKDKILQYEKEEKAKLVGFPTAKELRHAKEMARARLKREEEEAEKVGVVSVTSLYH